MSFMPSLQRMKERFDLEILQLSRNVVIAISISAVS